MILILIPVFATGNVISNLNSNWKFRNAKNDLWYPANVPSTVHLDLLDNNLIKDPYLENNLLDMYKYEMDDWEYQLEFINKYSYFQINELVFEGLDTHADIYLNQQLILQANNQHRTWKTQINKLENINTLRIYFHSAPKFDQESEIKHQSEYKLPYNYTYTRKASYQYGWDWGPRIVTCGIWKNVYLHQYNTGKINSLHANAISINQNTIEVIVTIDLFLNLIGTYNIELQLEEVKLIIFENVQQNKSLTLKQQLTLKNSSLWWPNGQGNQNLYDVQAYLLKSGSYIDHYKIKTGYRIAQWIQEGTIGNSTFKFKINGQDMYLKGANYIPPDMFMPRMLRNVNKYEKMFKNIIDAGFNGIRLWGGGQFEYDIFYELADKYGITIWHDLMFACAMYPADENYIGNVIEELKDNVRRLRIHPSIILWNGNNEVDQGWKDWGWKGTLTQQQIELLQQYYNNLFLRSIPNILNELQPEIFYWPTSPSSSSYSISPNFASGDIHYWGVWAAAEPIENYNKYIGRFNSEYGMQGMMEISSFKKTLSNQKDLSLQSYTLQLHERHIKGISLLQNYISKYTDYQTTTQNFIKLIYSSQIVQYLSLQTAISALRGAKPFNMGSYYWQLNDVWPVISWSSIDYFDCWKSGHYAAKKFHSDPLIFGIFKDNIAYVYISNDKPQEYSGNIQIILKSYNGNDIENWEFNNLTIKNNESQLIFNLTLKQYDSIKFEIYLDLRFYCNQNNCDSFGIVNFGTPKEWKLFKPTLSVLQNGSNFTFQTNYFTKYVYLYHESECLQLSDNFFDLRPNIPYTIQIQTNYQQFNIINYYDLKMNNEIYQVQINTPESILTVFSSMLFLQSMIIFII